MHTHTRGHTRARPSQSHTHLEVQEMLQCNRNKFVNACVIVGDNTLSDHRVNQLPMWHVQASSAPANQPSETEQSTSDRAPGQRIVEPTKRPDNVLTRLGRTSS